MAKRIAVVGYGNLGKYLVQKILDANKNDMELVFVWNRSEITDQSLDSKYILKDLNEFDKYEVDIIIEVAHPKITENYGDKFLKHASYMIGSPTVLANRSVYESLLEASKLYSHKIYVPCGAFWGADDIRKMADRGTLKGLSVTMKKHPTSLKLESPLKDKLEANKDADGPVILYRGPVRDLCSLAPNNVNTMAVGALCAHNLGFDKVEACLVSDKGLDDKHLIEIVVTGPYNEKLQQHFKCTTIRSNPAIVGHVTGNQTYESFYNSLIDVVNNKSQSGLEVC